MEKSSLASILQRKKNKNLTLAHRQLWGMIDLVYKDFYDKDVNVNIRMYNFDDVQCTVIPSVAYGFVTGMNLQLC